MRCGEYELVEEVASGATGTVFRARHATSGEQVAVKQLSTAVRGAPGMLERLQGEAQVLRSLDDPHVVRLRDADFAADPPWLAMQWVDGVTLDRLLEHHGPLSPQQAVGVLRGAVAGLAHAHSRGVVHRDVAPRNVMVDDESTSMLIDFGLASPQPESGVVGTPAFLSPEAARGEDVAPPGDVYSAGALLHLLLSGRPPFPGTHVARVLEAHREQEPPRLIGHGDGLADLVLRCLAKDPSARPRDGQSLLRELDEQAERRFGAGWLAGASLAGAVASAMRAGQTGQAAASTTTESVTLTTASAATGFARLRQAGAGSRTAVFVAVGLVASGGAAAAALALTGESGDGPDQPSVSPVSEERAVAASASGRYRIEATVVSTTFPDSSVGTTSSAEWTVTLDCSASDECEGVVGSDSGTVYEPVFNGDSLELRSTSQFEGPCVFTGTDEEVPDSLGRVDEEATASVSGFADLEVGESVAGSGTRRDVGTPLRNCEDGGFTHDETTDITITRLS